MGTHAAFSQVNLAKGLVAYYPFNGNSLDAGGNGNHSNYNNATLTADRFGNPNSAFFFNGIDNYIKIPNSPSLNPANGISICAWVKVKDFYTGPCRGNSIVMKGITEGSPAYKLRLDENHYPGNYSCGPDVDLTHQFFYGQGQGGVKNSNYDWIKKDQWYSVVYTYDGKTAKLYIDCVLRISVDVQGLSMTNNEDLYIGATNLPGYPYWFNGVLDEIRIYDRAINANEVMAYGDCCKIVHSVTHDPAPVCSPGTVNLITSSITAGTDPILTLSYFKDAEGTIPVSNPSQVTSTGVYYVKGTAKDICTTLDPVNVVILDRPIISNINAIQPTCTESTGSISVSVASAGNFNYSLDQISYVNTTGNFTSLQPKNYNITVRNADGCISPSLAVTINSQPVTPPTPIVSVKNNCDGTSTLSTTASGSLLWSTGSTGNSIIVNSAAVYTVTQTANGCTGAAGSGTADPKSTLSINAIASEITCAQPAGIITITATDGNSPYNYSIDGGNTFRASNVFSGLPSANYIVRVKDVIGCYADVVVEVKSNNETPDLKIADPLQICEPFTIDLTSPSVTSGSEQGLIFSYHTDPAGTTNLANPNAIDKTGKYYIKATKSNGCIAMKPVNVSVLPKSKFSISPDRSICFGDSVQIKAAGGTAYEWQPSVFLNSLQIADPVTRPVNTTTYSVKIKNNVCNDSSVLQTTIKVSPLPVIKATKSNDLDCTNNSTQLNATGGNKYTWSPANLVSEFAISNPIAKPTQTTLFTVIAVDENGCKNTDTISVNVDPNKNNKSGYSMPSAFTPNNDGLNDCFGLQYWGTVTKLSFSIYNRFGQKIFFTTDPRVCWDGKFRGIMQEVGAYVYMIQATTPCEEIKRRGTIMILR